MFPGKFKHFINLNHGWLRDLRSHREPARSPDLLLLTPSQTMSKFQNPTGLNFLWWVITILYFMELSTRTCAVFIQCLLLFYNDSQSNFKAGRSFQRAMGAYAAQLAYFWKELVQPGRWLTAVAEHSDSPIGISKVEWKPYHRCRDGPLLAFNMRDHLPVSAQKKYTTCLSEAVG